MQVWKTPRFQRTYLSQQSSFFFICLRDAITITFTCGSRGTILKCSLDYTRTSSELNPDHINIVSETPSESKQELTAQPTFDSWHSILTSYTQRKLSREEDKLAAILGIANEFDRYLNDRYLAGMWEGNLPEDLLWVCKDPQPRPHSYRAPS